MNGNRQVALEGVTPEKLRETFREVEPEVMERLKADADYTISHALGDAFLAGVLKAEVELAAQFIQNGVQVYLRPHDVTSLGGEAKEGDAV